MTDNLMRMIQLADEFFEAKNDPSQLDISQEVMEQLRYIHPLTMGEIANDDGPVAWSIVIPTTQEVREQFLNGAIGEAEILSMTLSIRNREPFVPNERFTALYLCSALVLPEFRGK